MKFFLAFLQSRIQHPVPAYDFWGYYIKNGIKEAGHDWTESADTDWALGLVPQSQTDHAKWKHDTWQRTVDYLKKNPVDVFLSYLSPRQIDTSAIQQIKNLGIPCVNFYCDNIREFKRIPEEFGVFDLNWVPEYAAQAIYKKAGYAFIHLPMPMWVEPGLRHLPADKYPQITFIGSKDVQRQMLLNEIVIAEPELPLIIYGNGWQQETYTLPGASSGTGKIVNQLRFINEHGLTAYIRKLAQSSHGPALSTLLHQRIGEKPSFHQYTALTAQSTITMGINRYPSYHYPFNSPNKYSRLRDIEAPMLGACYLTEWTPGIEDMYDTDTEINTYKTAAEFIERSGRLLADKHKREGLRANGQKRALSAHTIPASLNKIKCTLGL
ncbi:MAG: glycosyltransferase family 1 protein [Sphingobacteriaceae bacterium]|nr:MAG: glycosyltransferase family 1 protein [Sphingobacteriaceae bacterium]